MNASPFARGRVATFCVPRPVGMGLSAILIPALFRFAHAADLLTPIRSAISFRVISDTVAPKCSACGRESLLRRLCRPCHQWHFDVRLPACQQENIRTLPFCFLTVTRTGITCYGIDTCKSAECWHGKEKRETNGAREQDARDAGAHPRALLRGLQGDGRRTAKRDNRHRERRRSRIPGAARAMAAEAGVAAVKRVATGQVAVALLLAGCTPADPAAEKFRAAA